MLTKIVVDDHHQNPDQHPSPSLEVRHGKRRQHAPYVPRCSSLGVWSHLRWFCVCWTRFQIGPSREAHCRELLACCDGSRQSLSLNERVIRRHVRKHESVDIYLFSILKEFKVIVTPIYLGGLQGPRTPPQKNIFYPFSPTTEWRLREGSKFCWRK